MLMPKYKINVKNCCFIDINLKEKTIYLINIDECMAIGNGHIGDGTMEQQSVS